MKQTTVFAFIILPLFLFSETACSKTPVRLDTIKLPPGFSIDIYANFVPGARSMTLGPNGTLFVGTRDEGNVYAIVDRDENHRADKIYTIARGLNFPNGVALRDGSLYVAEINRILRYDNIESKLETPGEPVVVNDRFPSARSHGWKYIGFGPDDKLYVPVGAPCNICDEGDPYAAIHRMNPDGSGLEIYARGVRNTVGFDWHPDTKELWFTDNGRDRLGDNIPPDELNHAPRQGMHFGYPYLHGTNVVDPEYGGKSAGKEITTPAQELGPHVASLGMKFYTGKMFPEEYKNQIFIAEHGSWNRSVPIGYRITLVRLKDNKATGYEVFAEGWLQGAATGADLLISL